MTQATSTAVLAQRPGPGRLTESGMPRLLQAKLAEQATEHEAVVDDVGAGNQQVRRRGDGARFYCNRHAR